MSPKYLIRLDKPEMKITGPVNPSTVAGQSLTLTCQQLSGHPVVTGFLWTHNGDVIGNRSQHITYKKTHLRDAGWYTCAGINEAGKSDSDHMYVNILGRYHPFVFARYILFFIIINGGLWSKQSLLYYFNIED